MSDRSELSIVVLVMVAAAAVLMAPVLGRFGAPLLAETAMWVAALSGVAAFGVAGVVTWRAASRPQPEPTDRSRDTGPRTEEAR